MKIFLANDDFFFDIKKHQTPKHSDSITDNNYSLSHKDGIDSTSITQKSSVRVSGKNLVRNAMHAFLISTLENLFFIIANVFVTVPSNVNNQLVIYIKILIFLVCTIICGG